jgi:hypothetical protein
LLNFDAYIRGYDSKNGNNIEKTELTLSLSRYRREKEGFSAFCPRILSPLTKKRENGIRKTLNAPVGMGGPGKGMNPREYASKDGDQPKQPFLNNIRFQAVVALKRMPLEGLQTATNR